MISVVLASQSPRRRELLLHAGVDVVVAAAAVDEAPRPDEPPLTYAHRVAREKLAAAQRAHRALPHRGAWLAADTVVTQGGVILGKPRDRAEAERTVRRLTGGDPHEVTTAWAVAFGPRVEVRHETTRVWMRPLGELEVDQHLRGETWRDKAGGYGIQEGAQSWVTRIEGSYTNVVGLPVAQVLLHLQTLGA